MSIHDVKRAVALDPEDAEASFRLLTERSRIEGDQVWLEPLCERLVWNETSQEIQNQAIETVARRLSKDFRHERTRIWSCENEPIDRDPVSLQIIDLPKTTISHRLATFLHIPTGIELNLIPGSTDKVDILHLCTNMMDGGYGIYNPHSHPINIDITVDNGLLQRTTILPMTSAPYIRPTDRDPQHGPVATRIRGHEILDVRAPFLTARWPWCAPAGPFKRPMPLAELTMAETKVLISKSGLRLLTSKEWDYIARSGARTPFYWGYKFSNDHVWSRENSHEIDTFQRWGHGSINKVKSPAEHDHAASWSAFGLVDIWGNVWERVAGGHLYGGSFATPFGEFLRAPPFADPDNDDGCGPLVGFRVACDIPGVVRP